MWGKKWGEDGLQGGLREGSPLCSSRFTHENFLPKLFGELTKI
jgi:hypothetical protein